MSTEKALALVLRTADFSETSKVATLWTHEMGKVRVLAKGARRLKSNFESALDLLTLGSMVFIRKSSGSLDLLTEAKVVERFPALRKDMAALYGAYYIAELLGDWTEDYDPHPALFDEVVDTLRTLGQPDVSVGLRLLRFETVLLHELGYYPSLDRCAVCHQPAPANLEMIFSPLAGGVVCGRCRSSSRGRMAISAQARQSMKILDDTEKWRTVEEGAKAELRAVFNNYITHSMGRRPRTMMYLGV